MKVEVFGSFPASYQDLHNVWNRYNYTKRRQNLESFGKFVAEQYCVQPWPELESQEDDWSAYGMMADLFK